ncbi:MAG: type-4 uracil-DNA glycosylase [Candidatus Bathyarchaeia archaeon]
MAEGKDDLMQRLLDEIDNCRKCRLWRSAKKPVPGEGSLEASLMFIGEAPGYWEDAEGRPFIGAAGKLLDRILTENFLDRREIYMTNIVKHRPPMNRVPRADEVEACTPYLDRQIEIVKPRLIVTLGVQPTRYILSKMRIKFKNISEVRGRFYEGELKGIQVKVMPTLHPAAALYNPEYKTTIEKDIEKLRHKLP